MTAPAILTQAECEAIGERIFSQLTVPEASVELSSMATANTAFARGDAHMASESRSASALLMVHGAERTGSVWTNRLDEAGLRTLVREAEALLREHRLPSDWGLVPQQTYIEGPRIYFDSAAEAMGPEAQAAIFRRAMEATEAAGLIGAGDLAIEVQARWTRNTRGLQAYERTTYGELSLTARTKDGLGSGWSWSGFEDWARVDTQAVITRAVELAQRSARPLAVEPGRYTVILEPSAVAALVEPILSEWQAYWADAGVTVFSKDPLGTNKIGLQMMDRRLGMVSSPWDPDRPATTMSAIFVAIPGPVTWFEHGVLKNLVYDEFYAKEKGREPVIDPGGVRLTFEGPTQTLEEMIASTKRGVWVNRLSHLTVMNKRTLLLTGTTRDGTFLIENGKITKAIKNFRFTESPFFVFNKLEAAGGPVRASRAVIAPRLKLRDFDFTSLTDAI